MDFSRFEAGPSGAPWEKQDQFVIGLSSFIVPGVKLSGEYVHTAGYAPLNFISGGNGEPGETHSDSNEKPDLLIIGVNAAL